MADKINLLPADLNIRRGTGRAGVILKRLAIFTAVVFFLINVCFIGYTLYLNHQIDLGVKKQADLKTSIESLNQTEQKLFLIKDRIAKVEKVLDTKASENSIDKLNTTIASASESSSLEFRSAKIEQGSTDLTLVGSSLSEISNFLNSFILASPYSQVVLKNLGFNSTLGYSINMQMF